MSAIILGSSLSLAGNCIVLPMLFGAGLGSSELLGDESVQREEARTEGQNHDRSEEKGVGIGSVKFAGVAEDREECLAIGGPVCNKHRSCEQERDGARSQSKDKQDSTEEFKPGYEVGAQRGKWDIE